MTIERHNLPSLTFMLRDSPLQLLLFKKQNENLIQRIISQNIENLCDNIYILQIIYSFGLKFSADS